MKEVKNPEAVYGSVLIFVSTLTILFLAAFGNRLNHIPAHPHTILFVELCIMFITGLLLLFRKRNFIIGRINMMLFLVSIAGFYIHMLNEGLSSEGNNFGVIIYFLLFFLMNLMILIRIYKNKPRVY
jgi:hypothetical protein